MVNELLGQLREVEEVNQQLNLEVHNVKRMSADPNLGAEEFDGEAEYSDQIQ